MRLDKTVIRGTSVYLRHFEHWLDYVQQAEIVEREAFRGSFNGLGCKSLDTSQPNWHGTRSLTEAIELAYSGWPEGRRRIEVLREKIDISHLLPTSRAVQELYDVSGDEVNIDLFLSGEPEYMATMHMPELRHAGKIVRILVNRGVNWKTPIEQITRRGLAILVAIEALIMLGYSVELSLCTADESYSGKRRECTIPILHAGDPINLDSFAFFLMHPSLIRRIGFAVSETESYEMRRDFRYYSEGNYSYCKDPLSPAQHDLLISWEEGLLCKDCEVIPFTLKILNRVGVSYAD